MEKKGNKSSLRYKNSNNPQRASTLAGSPGLRPGRKRDGTFNNIFLDGQQENDGSQAMIPTGCAPSARVMNCRHWNFIPSGLMRRVRRHIPGGGSHQVLFEQAPEH